MTNMRILTEEELLWLAETPIGKSHTIESNESLAACEECDWTAQGDSFHYLMELGSRHLQETLQENIEIRQALFVQGFGWDPWQEGSIVAGQEVEDLEQQEWDSSNVCDILDVTETDEESGDIISKDRYVKNMGHIEDIDWELE